MFPLPVAYVTSLPYYKQLSSPEVSIMARPNIYRSPYPEPHVPTNLSVSQFLLRSDPDDAPRDKVIYGDFDNPQKCITYGGLHESTAKDAATLRRQYGLRKNDVVCIYAQNSLEWVSLAHAVLWAGGCFWYVEVFTPRSSRGHGSINGRAAVLTHWRQSSSSSIISRSLHRRSLLLMRIYLIT